MNTAGNPDNVRIADADDEDELMQICRFLAGENGLFPLSEDKVRNALKSALIGPVESRKGIVGVVGKSGSIEGCIYLELGQLWYSDDYTLSELWNYVLPQYRSSSNSVDLIAFAKHFADRVGVPLLIGVLSNQRTQAKVRLYRRALGEPSGAFFTYRASTGQGAH